jgi:lipoate-protein ligase A
MTRPIRIIDTGLRSARWNVAMTAALAARHADGEARDTIRFHRYAECVLLGRNQHAEEAVDVEHCRQSGIDVVHRVTGGGAVYMSPRMLAWDVVVDRRSLGGDLGTATRRICEGVAAGLSRLGCTARFRPVNDIEIAGLKVSGSSGYAEGRTIALQGTILIEDEVPAMARALRMAQAALRERVTCLAAVLGSAPALRQVQALVVEGLMTALGRTPLHEDPSPGELAEVDALLYAGRPTAHVARGVA